MLTPRECAHDAFLATRAMPRPGHVLGMDPGGRAELRQARINAFSRALRLLRAAPESPRVLPGEWDDESLTAAAVVVEADLAAEAAAPLPIGDARLGSANTVVTPDTTSRPMPMAI